jgi:hypothetical protein
MVETKEENVTKKVEKIDFLPSRSGNKTLYLVTVDDPLSKPKKRVFVSKYLDKTPLGIDFVGYEVDCKTKGPLSDRDAVDLANKGNRDLMSVLFPWHRVVSIRNASYKEARHIKNTIIGE